MPALLLVCGNQESIALMVCSFWEFLQFLEFSVFHYDCPPSPSHAQAGCSSLDVATLQFVNCV